MAPNLAAMRREGEANQTLVIDPQPDLIARMDAGEAPMVVRDPQGEAPPIGFALAHVDDPGRAVTVSAPPDHNGGYDVQDGARRRRIGESRAYAGLGSL